MNSETKDIRALMILEVIGKPPEHLKETLEKIISQIDSEKKTRVLSKKINEAKELEKQNGFFSNFAEIEISIEEISDLVMLMFKYMPSHVEIISPELIALSNNGWSDILTGLIQRLHGYDEIARVIQIEKAILEKRLRDILEQQKPKESEEKTKKAGKKKKENITEVLK